MKSSFKTVSLLTVTVGFGVGVLLGFVSINVVTGLFEALDCDADCQVQQQERRRESDRKQEEEAQLCEEAISQQTVYARLISMDENSVTYSTDLDSVIANHTYEFSQGVAIQIMRDKKLVEVSPSEAMEVVLASSKNYFFYFRVNNETNKVLEMVQDAEVAVAYILDVSGPSPVTFGAVSFDSVQLLSEAEGTCVDALEPNPQVPVCGSNGFLVLNEDTEEKRWYPFSEAKISTSNFGSVAEGNYEMSVEEFIQAYEANKDYFDSVLFEVEFSKNPSNTTVTSLKEIYIP